MPLAAVEVAGSHQTPSKGLMLVFLQHSLLGPASDVSRIKEHIWTEHRQIYFGQRNRGHAASARAREVLLQKPRACFSFGGSFLRRRCVAIEALEQRVAVLV